MTMIFSHLDILFLARGGDVAHCESAAGHGWSVGRSPV
jgi:hypothetical protein